MNLYKSEAVNSLYLNDNLIIDYLKKEQEVLSLQSLPFEIESIEKIIKQRNSFPFFRNELVKVFSSQYKNLPEANVAFSQIEKLKNNNTFTITTAHQNAFVHGPLYNIVKACHIIACSKELNEKFPQYHFIPVFWLGSEDHDFDELNHIFFNDEKYCWETNQKGAVGRMRCEGLDSSYLSLKEAGLINESLYISLCEQLKLKTDFATHTQFLLHHMFGHEGMLVLNPDNESLKSIFSTIIKREIEDQFLKNSIQDSIQKLNENYHVQASPRDINIFYLTQNKRERIEKSDNGYSILQSEISFTNAEIVQELKSNPANFSPNVLLRPLFQEMILPNIIFGGGGAEISYWLELKKAFENGSVSFPLLSLRNSIFLLSENNRKKLEKYDFQLADFFKPVDIHKKDYTIKQSGFQGFESEEAEIVNIFLNIKQKAIKTDVTLASSTEAELQKVKNSLQHLSSKIRKAEQQKLNNQLTQMENIYNVLFPGGSAQERRMSSLYFFNLFGKNGISFLCNRFNTFNPEILFLEY